MMTDSQQLLADYAANGSERAFGSHSRDNGQTASRIASQALS